MTNVIRIGRVVRYPSPGLDRRLGNCDLVVDTV